MRKQLVSNKSQIFPNNHTDVQKIKNLIPIIKNVVQKIKICCPNNQNNSLLQRKNESTSGNLWPRRAERNPGSTKPLKWSSTNRKDKTYFTG